MGESDVRTLNQLRERTMQAENAGDATFFEGASAEDVIVMPPGMPAVSGRTATVVFMSAFLGQFNLRIQSPLRAEARGIVSLGITYGSIRGDLMEGGSSHALSGTPANPPPLADSHHDASHRMQPSAPVALMGSVLVLAPDPDEAEALVQGFARRGIHHEDVRMEALDCVSLPALDMLIAVGGNGKAQYGIQAQYLINRCDGIELLVCAGAAGRLTDSLQIGDVVLGTATVEHDYKERFNPRPLPRYDASPGILSEFIRLAESMTFPFKVHFGMIASGDEDIVDPTRAANLRETTNALCVAWEGSGGARAARLNDLGFIEMRGITDGADSDAARFFHDSVNDVMFNVVELMMAWSTARQTAA